MDRFNLMARVAMGDAPSSPDRKRARSGFGNNVLGSNQNSLNLGASCSNDEVEIIGGKNESTEKNSEKQKVKSESKGVDRLIQDIQNLLDTELGCDVILKTSDHDFRAHRLILSARSPVFASMFQDDLYEKKTGEVDISDCSTAAFKIFLQFLYSGNKDGMSSSNILELYYIANKYMVFDLKSDCVECMKNNLIIENFCDIMALSLKHKESDLQMFAIQFFCKNMKGIVNTVQWQIYLSENPMQANELIKIAVDQ